MTLSDFCQNVFDAPSRSQYNGFTSSKEVINNKLMVIYKNLIAGLNNLDNSPEFNELLDSNTVIDNKFSNERWTDILAIVFDTLTELNRNPNLWFQHQSLNSELSNIFNVLFNGRDRLYSINSVGSIVKMNNKSYSDAKKILQKDLEPLLSDLF